MRRGSVFVLIVFLLLSVAIAGCEEEPVATTSTVAPGVVTTTAGGNSTSSTGAAPTSTTAMTAADPFTAPDYLEPQAVDLAAVNDLDKATLSDAQKEVLARQSFVAAVQDPVNGPWKFWHVYETARYAGLPILITTDSVLNAYHGLFDTLLQRMEEAALYDQCATMTEALYTSASSQWNTASDPAIKEDARLNMAFFAVAGSLLSGGSTAPDVVADEVASELALIEAAAGPQESPILGYTEDYSQYKPRGHYTRSERLKSYFKAMMWYGHTAFYINPRTPDLTEEEAVGLTRRAILVASSLVGEAKDAWIAIYEPTSFLVGRSDDLSVDDMASVLTEVFGTAQPQPDALTDGGKIATVREKMNELAPPKILSGTVREQGDTENREENERSFRVMGQRFIPDSYAFQQLVWAYVGDEANKRDLPMGLDIMAVLGSFEAYKLATEDFGQSQYANYESQIAKVHQEFAAKTEDVWPTSIYTGWLESLQQVMAFPAEGAPAFMQTQAWARKSLNTALGSWTELRHDTILYAKQSVTAEGDGGEEPDTVIGYVEPYPAFYSKIAELAGAMRQGMADYGLADSEATNKLDSMVELAETLASIAQKQLAGEELSTDETDIIRWYGSYLESLEHFDDTTDQGMTLSPAAERSPLVADVHTSYNTGLALEEATGYPLVLYAAFEVNGQLQLFCGASYAYYEFTAPLDGRLTDEEWTAMLDEGRQPARPAWTNEWIPGD